MTQKITYTHGQENGSVLFGKFYLNPLEHVFVIKGYSGTGKSTLVQRLLSEIPKLDEMLGLVDPKYVPYEVALTATTNQAAEALANSIAFTEKVCTIHQFLGLRVHTIDYAKNVKELRATRADKRERFIIFIDEASYIDRDLMSLIMQEAINCKFVFIGDHAQLKPVKSSYMPAFDMERSTVELTEMVRFNDGPIYNLVAALRRTVLEGIWPNFSDYLERGVIDKVDRDTFEKGIEYAFGPDKPLGRTKILAYSNQCVISYNTRLTHKFVGTSDPVPGQVMVNNEECGNGSSRVPNNSEVMIEEVDPTTNYGVAGWWVKLRNTSGRYFMPANCRQAKADAHKRAVQDMDYTMMQEILDSWIDLRPTFACTVNKAQGSTYDTTFIDLGNILSMVRGGDALARALYVGCSRAKSRMVFTGDVRG